MSAEASGTTAPPIVARRAPPPPPRIKKPSQENLNVPEELKQSAAPTVAAVPATEDAAAPSVQAPQRTPAPAGPLKLSPKGPGRMVSVSVGGASKRPLPVPPGPKQPAAAKDPGAAPIPLAQRALPRPVSMFPGKSPLAAPPSPGTSAPAPPQRPPKPVGPNISGPQQDAISPGAKKVGRPPATSVGTTNQAPGSPNRPTLPSRPSRQDLPVESADQGSASALPSDSSSNTTATDANVSVPSSFAPPTSPGRPGPRDSAPASIVGSRARPVSAMAPRGARIDVSQWESESSSSDQASSNRAQSSVEVSGAKRPRSPSITNSASDNSVPTSNPRVNPISPERASALSNSGYAASAPASPVTSHITSPSSSPGLGNASTGLGGAPDAQFVQVNLEALDLEALYPNADKRKSTMRNSDRPAGKPSRDRFATLRSLGASMKGLVGSSSSEDLSTGPRDDDPAVVGWPSIPRTRRQWAEPELDEVPSEVLTLIDRKVLETGFHIETGDTKAPREPHLEIDHKEEYISYFKENLHGIEHSNYIGCDEEADIYYIISCEEKKGKREKLRALVRSRKDYTRVLIDASMDRVKAIKAAVPDLAKVNLVKIKGPELSEEMAKMEAKEVVLGTRYKFGVLYAKAGQTEDEIFANEKPSADFEEFLDFLGDRISLQGWTKYTGGLDVKSGSTGEQSVFMEVDGISVMYHVCTLLPAQVHDLQRVERKRHIGNDVVTFVFKEGDEPFVPTILTSQFIHIVVVVQKLRGEGPTRYAISISTKFGVEPHMAALPHPAVFEKSTKLRDMLLYKCINSERTAMLSPEFRSKMMRSRKEFLKLMYQTYAPKK